MRSRTSPTTSRSFQGHFPQRPVMPGVIIIEALAQAAGILAFVTADIVPERRPRAFYFVGIDKARFRKPVEPGDQLMLSADAASAAQGHLAIRTVARRWTDGSGTR